MINPFDLPSLWKALRKFSLTFSVVFASALLGFSVVRLLRRALGELSLNWLFLWLVPMVVVGLLAKYEHLLVRDAALRRKIAIGVLLTAAGIHIGLARFREQMAELKPRPPIEQRVDGPAQPPAATPTAPRETSGEEDPVNPARRGPRSK